MKYYLVNNKRYDVKILIVGFKDNAEERIKQIYKQNKKQFKRKFFREFKQT